MQEQSFTILLREAEEGGFTAMCVDLPGCISEGDTEEEALAMIQDAIQGYLASLEKHGEAIPPDFCSPAPCKLKKLQVA